MQAFFGGQTSTITSLVRDPAPGRAVIIDPVLDFAPQAARTSTVSAQKVLAAAEAKDLAVEWLLGTHAHADRLCAAVFLKARTGANVAIGEHIKAVQQLFGPLFDAKDVAGDGAPFDRLLEGRRNAAGGRQGERSPVDARAPPACVSYKIGENMFVGDTLCMPDYGTARADFPGGRCACAVPINPADSFASRRKPIVDVP